MIKPIQALIDEIERMAEWHRDQAHDDPDHETEHEAAVDSLEDLATLLGNDDANEEIVSAYTNIADTDSAASARDRILKWVGIDGEFPTADDFLQAIIDEA